MLHQQDEANKRGGKWIIRLKKGLATKYWEDLVCSAQLHDSSSVNFCLSFICFAIDKQLLAVVGEQFQVGDEICGVVCSVRFNEDILSVWNRNADNKQAKAKIQYAKIRPVHSWAQAATC